MTSLMTVSKANTLIEEGHTLLFAGDEMLLRQLKTGNWIGGTIPYFMESGAGRYDDSRLFGVQLPDSISLQSMRFYSSEEIPNVNIDGAKNGVSFIIIPCKSRAHLTFAEGAPKYREALMLPLIGWISGVELSNIGTESPKVFLGKSGTASTEDAVVMHCKTSLEKMVRIDIINVFRPDPNGDIIQFTEKGFTVKTAFINGKEQLFFEYLTTKKIDTQLPLITDQYGALINVSIQRVDDENGVVELYAPVFPGQSYRMALPVKDYAATLKENTPKEIESPIFSCNCILNYLYANLEGKEVGSGLFGPFTFGEIAYQLLNQTLVYATLEQRNK